MCVETNRLTPIKAIRAWCLECVCGVASEVKLCPSEDCPLYPYRLGKNPNRSSVKLSDEERALRSERLKQARLKKKSDGMLDEECTV